jgi:hypothetical protein
VLDAQGRWLPVCVTRWDESARRAEAWVRLDSIDPASPPRLTVRVGNPSAPMLSTFRPDSVFRSDDGWMGVWGGGDGVGFTVGPSSLSLSATRTDTGFTAASSIGFETPSRAGVSLGAGDVSSGFSAVVTVSLAGGTPSTPAAIVSLLSDSGRIRRTFGLDSMGASSLDARDEASLWTSSSRDPGTGTDGFGTFPRETWTSLLLTFDVDSVRVRMLRSRGSSLPLAVPSRFSGSDLEIVLGNASGTGFLGRMGELRLSRGVLSADRIALEARNAAPTAAWLRWR